MVYWVKQMKRPCSGIIPVIILIFLFIQACTALPAFPFDPEDVKTQDLQETFQPGVLLVRAADSTTEETASILSSAHAIIGARVLEDYSSEGMPGLQLVQLPDEMNVEDGIAYYSVKPGIKYAEPDYYRTASVIPDDPELWRQWGLLNTGQVFREEKPAGISGADIKAAFAWNISSKSDIIIAVLDSGVDYLHEDLSDNIWTDPQTGTHGYDTITGVSDPMDLASHGTHCAGIIGAVGDNGKGGSGVSWDVKILPVRFLNSFGTGTVSNEIAGILWAARKGAEIFSCSYGSGQFSQAEYDVIAETKGLFICAAGNEESDNDIVPNYPSGYDLDNIITVAAIDAYDNLASFSNYGKESVDIGAPGVDIYSCKHNIYGPKPVWRDSFDSFSNWTIHGNWTLDSGEFVSGPSSAWGVLNRTDLNQTQMPLIISLNTPLNLANLTNPIISYQLQMVGVNSAFSVEASGDNLSWTRLEYDISPFTLMTWLYRECKIPADMTDGPLYLRFVADGTFIGCWLDDISLSDGYGDLVETRYGYMDGTSMATPFVSGMAGILATYDPDASYSDIKKAILETVDPVPGLLNITTTGGRANLSAALLYLKKPEQDEIVLYPGWNHVSVAKRLIAGNDTAHSLFGQITNTSGHSVLRYHNESWLTVQADEKITPLSSYWIWSGERQNIIPKPDPVQNGTYTVDLDKGWNGFGIVGTRQESAKTHLAPAGDNWTYVIGYDAMTQKYEEPIIRDGTGNQSDSRILAPWQGYWLYTGSNVTYQVTI